MTKKNLPTISEILVTILFLIWLFDNPANNLFAILLTSPIWGFVLYSMRESVFPSLVKRAKDREFATQPAHTIPATISDLPLLAEIDSDDSSLRVKLLFDSPNKNGWIELENILRMWADNEKLDSLVKITRENLIEVNAQKHDVFIKYFEQMNINRYIEYNRNLTSWKEKKIETNYFKSSQKDNFNGKSNTNDENNDYYESYKLKIA